jgi:hypothetical protein
VVVGIGSARLHSELGKTVRTLILSPDWDALLFWRDEQSQSAVDDARLPISDSLRAKLRSFGALHSELYFAEGEKPSDLDVRLLDNNGLAVWSELLKELAGLCRVLFFSHEFMESFERVEDFTTAQQAQHG